MTRVIGQALLFVWICSAFHFCECFSRVKIHTPRTANFLRDDQAKAFHTPRVNYSQRSRTGDFRCNLLRRKEAEIVPAESSENQLFGNLLKFCAIGWAVASTTYFQTLAVGENKIFGFDMSPVALGLESGLATDFSTSYAEFTFFNEAIDVPILLLLSTLILDNETFRRLASGAFAKHIGTLVIFSFGILNGYAGGEQFSAFLLLEVLTTASLLARMVDCGYPINGELIADASSDFRSKFDATKLKSNSLLSNFYLNGFFLSILVGASFAFSPVSPIAPVDVGETFVSRLLRANYGLGLMFLPATVSLILSEAVTEGTLGRLSSRVLNVSYGALVGISGYITLYGRSDSMEAVDNLSETFEQVDRFSSNTAAAGSIAALSTIFYLAQALLAKDEDEASK